MWGIYKKEFNHFFSSLIGYIVIGVFIIITGLMMFVFPDTSLLESRHASLDQLFSLAPFLFIFLIPAITMSSLAEERQSGTIELLATKPISDFQIIGGKFLGSLTLVVIALIPTIFYYYTVYQLGSPIGNLDTGGIIGSYIGLLFLAAAFTAMGVFASALTRNQIEAFILGAFLAFIIHFGFSYISSLPSFVGKVDALVQSFGIQHHYHSMSRGVIDSRDVIYFISIIAFFLFSTKIALERRKW